MTPLQLSNYIQYRLNITPADFSQMLDVINLKLIDISSAITKAQEDYFGVFGHINLMANIREYPLPNDVMNNLKMVFLRLDGTNFRRARFLNDWKDIVYQEDQIIARFNNERPAVGIFRNSLFIFSGTITNMVNGIQLWYINFPPAIPNLTENTIDLSVATNPASVPRVGLPLQFHELLARAVIIDYKGANGIALSDREPLFDKDLEEKIRLLTPKSLDEEFFASVPLETGGNL